MNLPSNREYKTIENCLIKTWFFVDKIKTSEYLSLVRINV